MKEPIRKRGYYRALKRGETWALMRQMMYNLGNRMMQEMFKPTVWDKMRGADNAVSDALPIRYVPIRDVAKK